MKHSLLLHDKIGFSNAPWYYVYTLIACLVTCIPACPLMWKGGEPTKDRTMWIEEHRMWKPGGKDSRYRHKWSRPNLLNLVTRSLYCRMAPFIDYWTLFPQRHIDGSVSEVHPIELYKETYPTLGFTHKVKKRRRRLVRAGTNSWNTKITTAWLSDLYSLNQFKIELSWKNSQMGRSNFAIYCNT